MELLFHCCCFFCLCVVGDGVVASVWCCESVKAVTVLVLSDGGVVVSKERF